MGIDYVVFYLIPNIVGGFYMFIMALGAAKRPRSHAYPPVENYLVVVVTVGDERVMPALAETVAQLESLGLRYTVLSSRPLPIKNHIVVPKEEDGSKYRAILWFVKNYARNDMWYIFLDDDSYPLDTRFLRDIAYYGARGCVAGNGVLVPRPGRSALAYALDWIRYFHDLTTYRFSLEVLRRPIFGMHGELLIVRGDVLRSIWPAMGDTITEDFRFAMELLKRRYKTFQTSTRVSIKSPNSLRDFVRQRARWAAAISEAAKYKNAYYLILTASPIALFLSTPASWLYGFTIPLLISAVYASVYIYGSLKAKRYILDVWLASFLELMGLIIGAARKAKNFYVIDKR
ncbi:glycosyltransferase family 2 protein [Pyrobaculum aerophilum]|uniref:glycosyltransferase family 2 protein n=1 Tax=Pyrobaculum aerophilum TaxID=13773 RepID=UPI002FD8BA78